MLSDTSGIKYSIVHCMETNHTVNPTPKQTCEDRVYWRFKKYFFELQYNFNSRCNLYHSRHVILEVLESLVIRLGHPSLSASVVFSPGGRHICLVSR